MLLLSCSMCHSNAPFLIKKKKNGINSKSLSIIGKYSTKKWIRKEIGISNYELQKDAIWLKKKKGA